MRATSWRREDGTSSVTGTVELSALGPLSLATAAGGLAARLEREHFGALDELGRTGEEIDQWRAAKAAACEAIVREEATITHHHAVGRDHAPYMEAEVGEHGIEALRALKERLDPAGIMNPGKLLPERA